MVFPLFPFVILKGFLQSGHFIFFETYSDNPPVPFGSSVGVSGRGNNCFLPLSVSLYSKSDNERINSAVCFPSNLHTIGHTVLYSSAPSLNFHEASGTPYQVIFSSIITRGKTALFVPHVYFFHASGKAA